MPPTPEPTFKSDGLSRVAGRAIVVATSAFGADCVRAQGQAAFVSIVADAGADGIEIRRELLMPSRDLSHLSEWGKVIAASALFAVYSAPVELFAKNGEVNAAELDPVFAEAAQLQARMVKLPLGHYSGASLDPLKVFLQKHAGHSRLLVENDQTVYGGTLAPLRAFFTSCHANKAGLPVGMTFDVGNWTWVGEDVLATAPALSPFVQYIHLKTAQRAGDAWVAVPVADSDPTWRQVLACFAPELPLGIEYPLVGDNLTAVTREQVRWLKATG